MDMYQLPRCLDTLYFDVPAPSKYLANLSITGFHDHTDFRRIFNHCAGVLRSLTIDQLPSGEVLAQLPALRRLYVKHLPAAGSSHNLRPLVNLTDLEMDGEGGRLSNYWPYLRNALPSCSRPLHILRLSLDNEDEAVELYKLLECDEIPFVPHLSVKVLSGSTCISEAMLQESGVEGWRQRLRQRSMLDKQWQAIDALLTHRGMVCGRVVPDTHEDRALLSMLASKLASASSRIAQPNACRQRVRYQSRAPTKRL